MNLEITLHKTAIGRSKIYYWLAHLFLANPTYEDLVRALDAQLLLALEETIDGNEPAVAWLRSFAKNLDRVSADRVSQTYSELFVVPIPGKYLPPYESCLRERISESIYGEIMGNASGRVAQFYRRNGFEPTAENTPPDHVGIELLFMSMMCQRETEAIAEKEQGQSMQLRTQELSFLREHLHSWLPDFAQALTKRENADFYAKLAQIAEIFVQRDMDYLESFQVPRP